MSISPSKQAAIAAYRRLLKTQREVFTGDVKAIQAARKETYSRFMQYKNEANVDVLDEKLKLADQVCSLLKQNGVKAVREEGASTPKLHINDEEGNIKFGDVAGHAKK
ncbi:uncharacterized protein BX663DRAFT_507848 [Cokeromyces recurvatus]|uniref:uncharacterized protein n=1 Tax=Cokeromyces recurvatus TaxID=90255 RepID=UPI002220D204|nr:uncharacterized protein BX663DRAFT_507848 [Cokeromyces recurvatus]KAI7903209.1 hypothetical protein BX663DRAFT_507848 [Cokeromyces recurvatus]